MTTRSIKFRAWDRGRMYNELAYVSMGGTAMSSNPDVPLIRPILMQSTGVVDRHGKEIYEGDIIRHRIEYDEGDDNHYFVVAWIQEWSRFAMLMKSEWEDYQEDGESALDGVLQERYGVFANESAANTIVGNIYQHPEILQR